MLRTTISWLALVALLVVAAPASALECFDLHFSPSPPDGSDAPVSCQQWYPDGMMFCIEPEPGDQTGVNGAGFEGSSYRHRITSRTSNTERTSKSSRWEQPGDVAYGRFLIVDGASRIHADILADPHTSASFQFSESTGDGPAETLCASTVEWIEEVADGAYVVRDYPMDYYPEDYQLGTPANGYLMAGVYLTTIFPRPGIHLDGGRVEYVATYTWSPVEILAAELGDTYIGWSPHLDIEVVFDEPVRLGGGAHATAYLFDWEDRGIRPAIYAETSLTGGGRGGFGQVVGGGLLFGWSPIYSLGAIARRTWTQHEDPWWTISLTLLDLRYPVGPEAERWVW